MDFDLNEAWSDLLEWDPYTPADAYRDTVQTGASVAEHAADNAGDALKWQSVAAVALGLGAAYVAARAVPEVGSTVRGVAKDLGAANLLKAIGL